MVNIKSIFITIIASIIVILSVATFAFYKKSQIAEQHYITAMNNVKAYANEADSLKHGSNLYKLTIAQLGYSKDSIDQLLNQAIKDAKIKGKTVTNINYISSVASRTDTLRIPLIKVVHDSIAIDTTLTTKWYTLHLGIRPNTIIVSPKFISQKFIICNYRKETVNPPKKFFLWRLFQKKQKIINVQVIEKNPNIIEGTQKFIEIVK